DTPKPAPVPYRVERRKRVGSGLRNLAADRDKLARRFAWRISPYIDAWKREGRTSTADLAASLNDCGAPVPSEYRGDDLAPTPTKQWTRAQVARLIARIDDVRERMAWRAKRAGAKQLKVYGGGAGLFAHPERAHIQARNKTTVEM